jgi:N-acetylneuraminate synthase
VPAYKVASSEIVDLPLIRAMAETGKPIIISTGMANLSEIDRAVATARETGNEDIVVLSCTASYPATPEAQPSGHSPARALLDTQIGLSDHTLRIGAAVAAVALARP